MMLSLLQIQVRGRHVQKACRSLCSVEPICTVIWIAGVLLLHFGFMSKLVAIATLHCAWEHTGYYETMNGSMHGSDLSC